MLKNFTLIKDICLINFKDMEYFHLESRKLIPLKLIDGNIYYRRYDANGSLYEPMSWSQFKEGFQEAIDNAYRSFCDETFEKQILTNCNCRKIDVE